MLLENQRFPFPSKYGAPPQALLVSYRYVNQRYGKALKGLKYIFVSPVPMSERGKELSEEASAVYGKGKQFESQYFTFH